MEVHIPSTSENLGMPKQPMTRLVASLELWKFLKI